MAANSDMSMDTSPPSSSALEPLDSLDVGSTSEIESELSETFSDSDWLEIASNRDTDLDTDADAASVGDSDVDTDADPDAEANIDGNVSAPSGTNPVGDRWEGFIDPDALTSALASSASASRSARITSTTTPSCNLATPLIDSPHNTAPSYIHTRPSSPVGTLRRSSGISPFARNALATEEDLIEDARVQSALEQSVCSTLNASRSSTGSGSGTGTRDNTGTNTIVSSAILNPAQAHAQAQAQAQAQALRLSFPDPISSSREELNLRGLRADRTLEFEDLVISDLEIDHDMDAGDEFPPSAFSDDTSTSAAEDLVTRGRRIHEIVKAADNYDPDCPLEEVGSRSGGRSPADSLSSLYEFDSGDLPNLNTKLEFESTKAWRKPPAKLLDQIRGYPIATVVIFLSIAFGYIVNANMNRTPPHRHVHPAPAWVMLSKTVPSASTATVTTTPDIPCKVHTGPSGVLPLFNASAIVITVPVSKANTKKEVNVIGSAVSVVPTADKKNEIATEVKTETALLAPKPPREPSNVAIALISDASSPDCPYVPGSTPSSTSKALAVVTTVESAVSVAVAHTTASGSGSTSRRRRKAKEDKPTQPHVSLDPNERPHSHHLDITTRARDYMHTLSTHVRTTAHVFLRSVVGAVSELVQALNELVDAVGRAANKVGEAVRGKAGSSSGSGSSSSSSTGQTRIQMEKVAVAEPQSNTKPKPKHARAVENAKRLRSVSRSLLANTHSALSHVTEQAQQRFLEKAAAASANAKAIRAKAQKKQAARKAEKYARRKEWESKYAKHFQRGAEKAERRAQRQAKKLEDVAGKAAGWMR